MAIKYSITRCSVFVALGLLAACSGSESDSVTQPEVVVRPTSPPIINQAKAFDGPLSKTTSSKVSTFIKNGIYSASVSNGTSHTPTPSPSLPSEGQDLSSDFSVTNTQEAGVDEADRIEYDGDIMYLASYPEWIDGESTQAKVRVLQRNEDFTLTQIDELNLNSDYYNIEGLYLAEQRLAVLGRDEQIYALSDISIEPWADTQPTVDISIFDTSDSSDIANIVDMKIEGWLLSSRRIENQLYVVSSFVPSVDSLTPYANTEDVQLQNYLTILDTPIEEIMPQLIIDGNSTPLVDTEDCFIPSQASSNDGYGQLLTITRINMQQPDDMQSVCMSSYAFMLYMSEDNLYLAGGFENSTGFHKFALSDLSYQAFGSVDGQLGWRGPPNLRVDEEGNNFRVVSTDFSSGDPIHKLTILTQQGDSLETIAELPNSQNPEPIGKPREDIFAVRFLGDKGYIVTFERIDPLYVIDLSNPSSPFVAGSLEIPGFSSYLHPMENGYLLGVGQQVSVENIPQTGTVPVQPPVVSGMKVSLFDVSDPSQPVEINSVVKEQAYTPVEYNYRALTVLNIDGNYQFAMPLEQWGLDTFTDFWTPDNSLLLLGADTTASQVELVEVDQLRTDATNDTYIYSGDDRSVIHGNHVYYIHGNQIWHGLWQQNTELDGPY
jgi:uncharacterized secreted protein with C-terminal beta-propeller domain